MTGFLGFGRRVARTELETLLETVLDRKLTPIHKRLDQLDIRIGRLEDNARETGEAISYLRAKMEIFERRMDGFESTLKENREHLEAAIQANRQVIQDNGNAIQANRQAIQDNGNAIQANCQAIQDNGNINKANHQELLVAIKTNCQDIQENGKAIEFLRGRVDVLIQLQSAATVSR